MACSEQRAFASRPLLGSPQRLVVAVTFVDSGEGPAGTLYERRVTRYFVPGVRPVIEQLVSPDSAMHCDVPPLAVRAVAIHPDTPGVETPSHRTSRALRRGVTRGVGLLSAAGSPHAVMHRRPRVPGSPRRRVAAYARTVSDAARASGSEESPSPSGSSVKRAGLQAAMRVVSLPPDCVKAPPISTSWRGELVSAEIHVPLRGSDSPESNLSHPYPLRMLSRSGVAPYQLIPVAAINIPL